MIADGDVRVLVDLQVTPEAIVVLRKGLGFVPTPSPDTIEARLDARRVTNKITYLANRLKKEEQTCNESQDQLTQLAEDVPEEYFTLPKNLRQPNYFQAYLKSTDPEFVTTLNYINTKANNIGHTSKKRKPMNLSVIERRGLKWLQKNVSDETICICKADKGGAILLVPPEMIAEKIEEKVKKP